MGENSQLRGPISLGPTRQSQLECSTSVADLHEGGPAFFGSFNQISNTSDIHLHYNILIVFLVSHPLFH